MAVQGVSIALSTEDVARSVKFYVERLASPAHYNWKDLRAFVWALPTLCWRSPTPMCRGKARVLLARFIWTSIMSMRTGARMRPERAANRVQTPSGYRHSDKEKFRSDLKGSKS